MDKPEGSHLLAAVFWPFQLTETPSRLTSLIAICLGRMKSEVLLR